MDSRLRGNDGLGADHSWTQAGSPLIRALIVDLDGTLIDPSEEVSARVKEAVGRLARRIPVSIATGRESRQTVEYANRIGLTSPQICDGGARIVDPSNSQILWFSPLDPVNAERVVRYLHRHGVEFIATYPAGSVRSFDQINGWDVVRVSALDMTEDTANAVAAELSGAGDMQVIKVYLPYNDLWAVDFTRAGVDKGEAATQLMSMLGARTEDAVAAGDSYNDLPLLRVCGSRIVMGDAPEELKELGDYIAPPAEQDGLAQAIEEFILPRLATGAEDDTG